MRTIRELTCSEFKEVYQDHVKQDFPAKERRPWFAIQKVWRDGNYSAYGYEEEGQLLAYASLYAGGDVPYVLLDYYAVIPPLRGRGVGGAFLRDLRGTVSGTGGIFIEAEDPNASGEAEERETRERRLSFYLENGSVLTGVNCHLFGVDYAILYLPIERELQGGDAFLKAVSDLYQAIYHPLGDKMYHVYPAGENQNSDAD